MAKDMRSSPLDQLDAVAAATGNEIVGASLPNGDDVKLTTTQIAALGGGGGGTDDLPAADVADFSVDTTTYDNTVKGSGKLRTAILAELTALLAIAQDGDAFPRMILTSDPTQSGPFYLSDGTVDPVSSGINFGQVTPNGDGTFAISIDATLGTLTLGQVLTPGVYANIFGGSIDYHLFDNLIRAIRGLVATVDDPAKTPVTLEAMTGQTAPLLVGTDENDVTTDLVGPDGKLRLPQLVFHLASIADSGLFGADGTVPIVGPGDAFANDPVNQAVCAPAKVAPGGTLGRIDLFSPVDCVVSYAEINVSNLACTERIQFVLPGTFNVIKNGTRHIVAADWGSAASQVGSDLSMDLAGNVITAAGGIFVCTGVVAVAPQ